VLGVNIPSCRVVWFAPTPRSSGGRSAVSSSSGRGAGRADHERRHPRLPTDADRRESGDALVDPHVQAHRPARLQLGRDERERLRPRSGAQHDVPDAELHQRAQQRCGGVRRRRGARSRFVSPDHD
jgi:hypothetical protein